MSDEELVSTKQVDYLDEDKQIRGQNYCLLSFLSPEDVLINKENYYFSKFINNFAKDMKTLIDGIESKYPESKDLVDTLKNNHSYIFDYKELNEQYNFYKSVNSSEIENDFHRENNFKTSMRGIKVRGTFDTIEEARNRSEFLKKLDNKFDIYIAQVGCWCPWSPNPNDLQDQEYSETQLNTLMKKYKENMETKDEVFQNRKDELVSNSKKPVISDITDNIAKSLEDVDPWTASKSANQEVPTETSDVPVSENVEETPVESSSNVVSEESTEPESDNVSSDEVSSKVLGRTYSE